MVTTIVKGVAVTGTAVCLFLCISCASVQTTVTKVDTYDRLKAQVSVAVMDVMNKTKYGARNLSDAAAEILTSELSRSRNFILV